MLITHPILSSWAIQLQLANAGPTHVDVRMSSTAQTLISFDGCRYLLGMDKADFRAAWLARGGAHAYEGSDMH